MPEWAKLQRKTGQKASLIASYKRFSKDSDRDLTPAAEAVLSLHTWRQPGSPQAKQLRHLHARLCPGQSCHGQKSPCVYACRAASVGYESLRSFRLWPARLL